MAQHASYQGFARKHRPQTFDDLVGQEAVAESLQKALTGDRVAHGHMLAGPRGVGKTTSARILARALNCKKGPTAVPCGECTHCVSIAAGNDMDVIEIDAASNTKVEQMREILERVIQAPFAARYKVYIIDEVHMLSIAAFNALLKTLEEPPRNVVFIFATTELEKVPETIRSRCAIHQFRRIGSEDIARRLAQVAEREGLEQDGAVLREVYMMIARSVDGGMRDALVLFDQLVSLTEGKPTVEAATQLLGIADHATLINTVQWIQEGASGSLLELIEDLVDRGRNLERFVKGLVTYLRDLMLLQAGASDELISMTGENLEAARKQADTLPPATMYNMLNQLFELENRLRTSVQARFLIEFTLLRLAAIKPVVPLDAIMRRIEAIPEASLQGGGAAPAAAAPDKGGAMRRTATVEPVPARENHGSAHASHEPMPIAAPAMLDSKPEATAPTGLIDSSNVADALAAGLPAKMNYLARYLHEAKLELDEGQLKLTWPHASAMSRSVVEKPKHNQVIEQLLGELTGRAIRVIHESEAGGAEETGGHDSPAAAFGDSRPAALGGPKPAFSFSDARPAATAAMGFDAAMAGEASNLEQDMPATTKNAKPVDTRSAIERARAFIESNEDARPRIKMLTDMVRGSLVDDHGEPISI